MTKQNKNQNQSETSNSNDVISLDFFRKSGKKGGSITAKRGKEFYKKIGLKGANKRWGLGKNMKEGVSKKDDVVLIQYIPPNTGN